MHEGVNSLRSNSASMAWAMLYRTWPNCCRS